VFNVTGADGAPTTQLCPGANYTLEVGWEEGGGGARGPGMHSIVETPMPASDLFECSLLQALMQLCCMGGGGGCC
jgi:hypothetical protein